MNEKLQRIHSVLSTPKTNDGRIYFHPILMMHASYQFGETYTNLMTNYKVLVEANMKCLELYDHDAVSVISDPNRETSAFGAKVIFGGNNSPVCEKLITCMDDVIQLKNPNIYQCERTLDRINGVRLFREILGNKFPIIGWIEGPLAEAVDLSGISETLMNIIIEPDLIKRLTQKCLTTGKDFALAQIAAGANIIGVGDAICSQISAEMYDEYCLPLHQELFDFIHQNGGIVKLHICGNITHLLPSLSKAGVDILDCDWMVDMGEAHRIMGPEVMMCGNLDPVSVILEGNKETIRNKFEEAKNSLPIENWILMGGCEIPMHTPVNNVKYLREISLIK